MTTAFDSILTGETILLGLGTTAWDDCAKLTEVLVNAHSIGKNSVIVQNISKRDGGLQRLEIGKVVVDLDFTDLDKLLTSIQIRNP